MSRCAVIAFITLGAAVTLPGQSVVELTRDVINDYAAIPELPLADGSPYRTVNERAFRELQELARGVDTVVEASAESRRCAFSSNGTFVDSEWSFRVVDLFKNESSGLVSPGVLITVARPGGELQLGGVRYIAVDRNVPDWVEGQTYILLLRSAGAGTSFLVTDDGLVYLDDYQHRSELPGVLKTMSTAEAIHWIASAAAR
jgi:hypothetical protein